jgi:RHS repeat-associated protein
MRGVLGGTVRRYVYNGERVLEDTDDLGATLSRYTTASGSYFSPLLHFFTGGDWTLRQYPAYDNMGTARLLLRGNGAITDNYVLDTFGRLIASSGTTPNSYRFGAAWGYITDTPGSGLLQLGARYYWPEIGRFIQQDPIGDGINWYAYADNNPVRYLDADGASPTLLTGAIGLVGGAVVGGAVSALEGCDWKQGAIKGAIAGGVAGVTLGVGWPTVVGLVGGGVWGGAVAGGVSSMAGDLAGQGYGMLTGQQCGGIDWPELGISGAIGAATGGIARTGLAQRFLRVEDHPISPAKTRPTGMSKRVAGRLHQDQVPQAHINIGPWHVIINRYNWFNPLRWFVK